MADEIIDKFSADEKEYLVKKMYNGWNIKEEICRNKEKRVRR